MTTATHYAAIDESAPVTGAVYGVGRTQDLARRRAERDGAEGPFTIVPCTPAAARYVRENGGAPSSRLTVTPRGVMLRDEEDEPRDEVLPIRLTASEYRILREGARRAGLGVGPWLRSLGLREAGR